MTDGIERTTCDSKRDQRCGDRDDANVLDHVCRKLAGNALPWDEPHAGQGEATGGK
jgi:hypothetical protein